MIKNIYICKSFSSVVIFGSSSVYTFWELQVFFGFDIIFISGISSGVKKQQQQTKPLLRQRIPFPLHFQFFRVLSWVPLEPKLLLVEVNLSSWTKFHQNDLLVSGIVSYFSKQAHLLELVQLPPFHSTLEKLYCEGRNFLSLWKI